MNILAMLDQAYKNIFGGMAGGNKAAQASQQRPAPRPAQPQRPALQARPAQVQGNQRYGGNIQGGHMNPQQMRGRFPQAQGYSPSLMQAGWNMPMDDLEISRPMQGGYADQGNINMMPGAGRPNPNYRAIRGINQGSGFNTRQNPNRILQQLLRDSGMDY